MIFYVPRWVRESVSAAQVMTLSEEDLTALIYRVRPPGAAVDMESCHRWAQVLREEDRQKQVTNGWVDE
jgi:hypothetical protein